MLLMVKVEAFVPPENIRHLWREHIVLHEPVSHVVILPAPAPEIHAIPIDPLKLLSGEDADTSKEVLPWHTVDFSNDLIAPPGKRRFVTFLLSSINRRPGSFHRQDNASSYVDVIQSALMVWRHTAVDRHNCKEVQVLVVFNTRSLSSVMLCTVQKMHHNTAAGLIRTTC